MTPTTIETHRRRLGIFGLGLLAAVALLSPAPCRAQKFVPDDGVYHVYQNNNFLGDEHVTFEQHGDSSFVISTINQQLPHPDGSLDTLTKSATLIREIHDGDLRGYSSYELLNRDPLNRSLSMSDTTYTSYRQVGESGFGDTFARPPGRIYIVDPQVFALFDVLCRDMHAQRFDERPITLLYLTARDTSVDGRVQRLGTGAFKLGKETVTAEKFSVTDPWTQSFIWAGPDGRMLRMMMPAVGLRVDRDPESLAPHAVELVPPPPTGMPAVDMGTVEMSNVKPPVAPDSLPPARR